MSKIVNRAGVALHLKVSKRTVSELQRKRLIPFIRIAKKCIRFDLEQVDRAIERLTVRSVE